MPALIPLTTPVLELMVATEGVLLFQVPPPASLSVIVEPTQTFEGPDIGLGKGLTVITLVVLQPVTNV